MQEEIEILNKPFSAKVVESIIQNIPKKKSPGSDGFRGKYHQKFKEKLISILSNLFQKAEEEGTLPNSLKEASITPIPKSDRKTYFASMFISMNILMQNPQQNTSKQNLAAY